MKNFLLVLLAAAMAAVTYSACDILDPREPGQLVPKTVDEDPSLPSISVNGTQLHAETFGNPADPMIVVVHGGPGGDYRGLLNFSRFSADGYFVVFYDQRGSGLSKRYGKEIYTIPLIIEDLDAVIKHYRQNVGQKVFLMGHSWGAMLATAYINEHPGEISGAVLIEPGGLTWDDAKAYTERYRELNVFDETSNDYVYVDQIITGNDHIMLDYKAGLQSAADFAAGNRAGDPGPVPFWRMGAVFSKAAFDYANEHPFDFTTNLRAYTTRVLFVYSELNKVYGDAHAAKVSSAYPNVQLVKINGSGHEIPYFAWDKLHPVATTYLNTIR